MSALHEDMLYSSLTYGHLIVECLRRSPDEPAFIHADRSVTHREATDRVGRLMTVLQAHGLRPGDSIALLSSNRIEAVLVLFASLIMGLRYVPLHPLAGLDDHSFILEDAAVKALVFAPEYGERTRELVTRVPAIKHVFCLGASDIGVNLESLASVARPASLEPQGVADDVTFLSYTGGTTGRPKGVMLSHRSMVTMAFIQMGDWDLPRRPRFLAMTPITHAAVTFIVPVLLRGGTVVLHNGFSPHMFVELVKRHRISLTFVVPTMLYALLDTPDISWADLSSLEMLVYGAAPASPARLLEALRRFGPILAQLYGQTEAPNTVTWLRREDHDPTHIERLASCGQPCTGVIVSVLDEQGNEVPTGNIGELCVRGPLVMNGYWHRPEETALALRGGWLHTSDLARRDSDGFLYLVDRAKDMIITGGFNVYSREVEDALLTHPAVAQVAVIGVPDEKWGEAVTAFVVLRSGQQVEVEALQTYVRTLKGPIHTPKQLSVVETLPLTGLGKPDKKLLRARYWEGRDRAVN